MNDPINICKWYEQEINRKRNKGKETHRKQSDLNHNFKNADKNETSFSSIILTQFKSLISQIVKNVGKQPLWDKLGGGEQFDSICQHLKCTYHWTNKTTHCLGIVICNLIKQQKPQTGNHLNIHK